MFITLELSTYGFIIKRYDVNNRNSYLVGFKKSRTHDKTHKQVVVEPAVELDSNFCHGHYCKRKKYVRHLKRYKKKRVLRIPVTEVLL